MWETTPPAQKIAEATVQIERFTYPDGKIWNDFGRGTCTVSSVRGKLKEERTQTATVPAPSTATSSAPSNAPSTAPSKAPTTPASSQTRPQMVTGVTPASALSASANTDLDKPSAVQIATPATVSHEPVTEEASTEATRRFAPLVAQKKASICTVATTPSGAEVVLDGKKLGVTPMIFVMVKKAQARQLTLTMPGYHSVQYSLFPDGNPVPLTVHLSKEATEQTSGQ